MVSIHSPLMAKCLLLPLVPQASMPAYILKRGFKGVSENGSLGKGLGSGFRVLQIPIHFHHHGFHGAGRIMSKSLQAMEEFGPVEHKSATTETLELLEWPRLCRALASFAATTLGKEQLHGVQKTSNHLGQGVITLVDTHQERDSLLGTGDEVSSVGNVVDGGLSRASRLLWMASGQMVYRHLVIAVLEIPATKEASEKLLEFTSAGVELISLLGGPFEFGSLQTEVVKNSIVRARKGVNVSGLEALSVALILQMGQSVRRSITNTVQEFQERQAVLEPLLDMVSPIVTHPELVKAIWNVVDEDGSVKDNASPELRRARIQQRSIEQRLQELLNKLTRNKAGFDNQAQDVVNVDGRMCLVMTSDNRTQVPGLLLRSGSGATTYVEPAAAVPLNNKLSEARADVLKAEYEVLSKLTDKLRPYLNDIQFCLDIIIRLDLVMARAKFSTWLGATKPTFINVDSPKLVTLQMLRARHPLLVQQHREVLRERKANLKSRSRNLSRLRARAGTTMAALQEVEAACAQAEAEVEELEENTPVPIDLRVRSETKVVAITGPNTGGKTATIKTVGLAALMAKAGLYVLAIEPVLMPWFDKILADIGDEQSLSQSLSTFSGHLHRIKRIKKESTGNSLVLLDEVGAGTDPTEGAALGMALLESFAQSGQGGSLLTMATTHHGELKTLKYSDTRFENASVEFSEEKLRPTYKLLWGIPGRSNALNIAARLGLPNDILAVARDLHGVASAQLSEVIMELEEARRDYDDALMAAEARLMEAKKLYGDLAAASVRLQEQKNVLELEKGDRVAEAAAITRSQLSALARNLKGTTPRLPIPSLASNVSTTAQPSKEQNSAKNASKSNMNVVSNSGSGTKANFPAIGDMVYVPKLSRNAKVIEVGEKEITVQSGFLQVKVKLQEIQ